LKLLLLLLLLLLPYSISNNVSKNIRKYEEVKASSQNHTTNQNFIKEEPE